MYIIHMMIYITYIFFNLFMDWWSCKEMKGNTKGNK